MFTVYILFSKKLNKYYTGFTSLSMEERLSYHNYNNKGFTGKADDWNAVYTEVLLSKKDALILEKTIKKRGAKRFLNDKV